MGGEGGGTNPEQLFAVGFAAYFESALGVVGRREPVEVGDVSIDSRVSLLPEVRGFKLAEGPPGPSPVGALSQNMKKASGAERRYRA